MELVWESYAVAASAAALFLSHKKRISPVPCHPSSLAENSIDTQGTVFVVLV